MKLSRHFVVQFAKTNICCARSGKHNSTANKVSGGMAIPRPAPALPVNGNLRSWKLCNRN